MYINMTFCSNALFYKSHQDYSTDCSLDLQSSVIIKFEKMSLKVSFKRVNTRAFFES